MRGNVAVKKFPVVYFGREKGDFHNSKGNWDLVIKGLDIDCAENVF